MTTIASQITSLAVVYSTVYSDADQSKHQSSASLAFVWGIHRDRWIPCTKGQLRGKCFHLMTSSWNDINCKYMFLLPLKNSARKGLKSDLHPLGDNESISFLFSFQPASARGIGIKVIHKWNQIPRRRPVIVQKYLARPYLINDSKFDLRIYVYVTSYDPLRIYVYDDGLVRFASMK